MEEQSITPFLVYALFDGEDKKTGQIEVGNEEQEERLQNGGYGIFWTVNEYEGARKAENITKINYWFCDIDSKQAGSKEEMLKKIASCRIRPTFIIESKNGFHCYWKAINATIENYKKIEQGIIKKLNADPAAQDPVRLLRKVYSAHVKDINHPFCIRYLFDDGNYPDFNAEHPNSKYKLEWFHNEEYEEPTMLSYFTKAKTSKPVKRFFATNESNFLDETKWDKMFDLPRWSEGNRNCNFARVILWLKDAGVFNSDIEYIVYKLNSGKYFAPLPEREINQLLRSKGIC